MSKFDLRQGDCLDVMGKMSDGSVDLIVTSPPYNLGISTGGGLKGAKKSGLWKGSKLADGYATYSDDKPREAYIAWQRAVLTEAWRLIPESGAIFYNHKPRIQAGEVQLPTDFNPDLPLRQIVIWDRGSGMNHNLTNFTPSHEWIMIFAKPKFRLVKRAADKDVWRIAPAHGNAHPAPFPVEIARRCIQHTDAKTVLDPFSGSGSTGVAALELNRRYVGIELDAGYLEQSRQRLSAVTAPMPTSTFVTDEKLVDLLVPLPSYLGKEGMFFRFCTSFMDGEEIVRPGEGQ
jgi:site-specific DNA-methyltransferase (adenine-specific)